MDALFVVLQTAPGPLWLGIGYLAGSIPFGLILALLVAKKDVRLSGSGNIGATNVARVVGRKLGVLTLFLDAGKGAVPVLLVGQWLDLPPALAPHRFLFEGLVGLAALIGHCFPVWLKLRGGKGVATGLGVLLAHRPEVAAVGLVFFAVIYAATRLVSVGSLAAIVAVLAALAWRGPHDVTLLPFSLCAAIIVAKHHGNIRRLWKRAELKV